MDIKKAVIGFIFVMSFLVSCGYGNLDYVKSNAKKTFEDNGYRIVGYEGYQIGDVIPFTTYGGAKVWYNIKRIDDDKIIYNCYLNRWGNEIHLYKLRAINVTAQQDE